MASGPGPPPGEDGPPGGWGAGPNPLVDAPHCQKPGSKKPKVSLADLDARPWGGGSPSGRVFQFTTPSGEFSAKWARPRATSPHGVLYSASAAAAAAGASPAPSE